MVPACDQESATDSIKNLLEEFDPIKNLPEDANPIKNLQEEDVPIKSLQEEDDHQEEKKIDNSEEPSSCSDANSKASEEEHLQPTAKVTAKEEKPKKINLQELLTDKQARIARMAANISFHKQAPKTGPFRSPPAIKVKPL